MKTNRLALGVVVILTGGVQAALQVTPTYSTTLTDFQVSSTDLINAGQSTLSNVVTGTPMNSGGYVILNDGNVSAFAYLDGGYPTYATAAYYLNTASNSKGYDITSIKIYSSFPDERVNQDITVTLNYLDGRSADTVSWNSWTFSPYNGGSLTTTITDTVSPLQGVSSLAFSFGNSPASGAGTTFYEVDVFGSATPIPEPATLGLLLGLATLGLRKRR